MTYIPHSEKNISEMLEVIGVKSISKLFSQVPEEFHKDGKLKLPAKLAPFELERLIDSISKENKLPSRGKNFLGAGLYNHWVPSVVDEITSRQEYYTAYTPYQPEISQGTLTTIFEYQTMMARLTGLPISNASLYDGATGVAEAAMLSVRSSRKNSVLVSKTVHPEYRKVLKTYMQHLNVKVIEFAYNNIGEIDTIDLEKKIDEHKDDLASVIVGSPNFFGIIEDIANIKSMIKNPQVLLIASLSEPMSLALVNPPGKCGADIVVGEALSFGNYINFGGPTLGFITVKENLLRNLPGRVCGETVDKDGRRAFVFTLSTREQHIRREKATSNICSNQNLLAMRATIYLSYMGEKGLKNTAIICNERASYAKKKFEAQKNISLKFSAPFFNEFVIEVPDSKAFLEALQKKGIQGGLDLHRFYPELKNNILVSYTELNSIEDIDLYFNSIS